MVVRSRLQLTLAILKPDLMMHPVRTKVRKVLVRFLRCPIHLFMRQSHIISHKIEWASEVEAYISLIWFNVMGLCGNLTPAYPWNLSLSCSRYTVHFSVLTPRYTSAFLPHIILPLLPPSILALDILPPFSYPRDLSLSYSKHTVRFPLLTPGTPLPPLPSYPRSTCHFNLLWQNRNCFHDRKWRRS